MEGRAVSFLFLSGLCLLPVSYPGLYIFVERNRTWSEAQSFCREKFTDLASVRNQTEQDQLRVAADKHYDGHLWIGLKDDINSWRWSLGEEGFDPRGAAKFWNLNNRNGHQTCVVMHKDGEMNDLKCSKKMTFICYSEKPGPGFVYVAEEKSWEDAQRYCRENYIDLASVRNQSEKDLVRMTIQGISWIGLHRDSWEWSDGSPYSFQNWSPGRPSGGLETPCVGLHKGGWEDHSCDRKAYFMCHSEKKKKQHVLKVKVALKDSSVNLDGVADAILAQYRRTLRGHGLGDHVKLAWRKQPDGKIFRLEKEERKETH